MKILFVGAIFRHYVNTTHMRMRVLSRAGHEVRPLCMEPFYDWGGRFGGALFRRLRWGPPLWRLGRAVVAEARRFRPDLVWIDKGPWITPGALRGMRAAGGAFLVHFTPDPAILFHGSRHFLKAIRLYDLLVTTKSYEMELYRRHGARNLLLRHPAFDLEAHRPMELSGEERRRYACDVLFAGSYAPGRERYLRPLRRAAVDLAVWGGNWKEGCRDRDLLRSYRGSPLYGGEYARALSSAKIGLGLLSPLVPDRTTTRSLEIPACGAFLLAERTEEHEELFEPGREAEFFDSEEELVEKVRYYLSHDRERERIAAAGRRRCLSGALSYRDQVAAILDKVAELGGPGGR